MEGGRKRHLLWLNPCRPPPPAPVFTQEPVKDQPQSDEIPEQEPDTTAGEGYE